GRGRLHAGKRRKPVEYFSVKHKCPVGFVSRELWINGEGYEMVSRKADVECHKVAKGAHKKTSADEKQQAERNLCSDCRASQIDRSARDHSRLLFESLCNIGSAKLKCRREAKQDAD